MAVRDVIDEYMRNKGQAFEPVLESNSIGFLIDTTRSSDALTFIVNPGIFGRPLPDDLTVRNFSGRDMPHINLQLGQLRGKVLSVAAAKFASQVALKLSSCAA